ncbi:MAG TPA: glutamate mutase L [Candidatus Limnocylindria bacterium]|nr:glutamate mutase L [Candidatus Limnocylindria bacterium]
MTDPLVLDHPTAEMSLLVDEGSAWTKAALVARVRGRWRVVAHAAQPSAWPDAELIAALATRLAESADRRLADDLVPLLAATPRIACRTPARPGRLVLAAVSRDVSGAAARRAAEAAGWIVVEEVSIDDGRSLLDRLAALGRADADAWLLVGGFDDAATDHPLELASLVAAARRGDDGAGPVLWAGSAPLADAVAATVGGEVTALPNPRATERGGDAEPLRAHLEELLQGLVEPGGVLQLAPIAFRRGVAELARATGLRTAGVEIGAQYATWVRAEPNGEARGRVFAAGGTGSPLLTASGVAARVARHLALSIDELAVADALQNQRARPAAVPQTEDELAVAHGAARLRLEQIAAEEGGLSGIDLVVAAGRVLAAAPSPWQAAQLLVDGLRPVGVTQLAIDPAGILAPLGSLPDAEIGEGFAAIAGDAVVPLGTAVVSRGGRPGSVAMRVRVRRAGWGEERFEVRSGQVVVEPLPRGAHADLDVELLGGTSLGTPRRSAHVRVPVSGGSVGLILDARDVPLALPRRSDDRRAVLAGWRDAFADESQVGWEAPR